MYVLSMRTSEDRQLVGAPCISRKLRVVMKVDASPLLLESLVHWVYGLASHLRTGLNVTMTDGFNGPAIFRVPRYARLAPSCALGTIQPALSDGSVRACWLALARLPSPAGTVQPVV